MDMKFLPIVVIASMSMIATILPVKRQIVTVPAQHVDMRVKSEPVRYLDNIDNFGR